LEFFDPGTAMELLERSALLTDLDNALAAEPEGRVVLVAGEAGIGKSALVRRFIQRHEGDARFLIGLCDPLLTPRALGPLRDIAGQIGGPLAERLAAGAAQEEIFTAFLDELAAHNGPQVIIVEDAHWADEATMDLLIILGRRLERLRVLLIVTYRDDELGTDHPFRAVLSGVPSDRMVHIRPAPLSEAAVAELARRAGRPGTGLHAITGGNPLLVIEVLEASELGVPTTVRDLALARFAALTPLAQEVVRFVAVNPTRTELWLLKQAMGPDPLVVESCVAGGLLLLADDAIAFRHELIRQAVEQSLSALRQEELNRRALEVLSDAPGVDLARLVHHARQAGEVVALLRYAPQAAQEAEAAGAHRQAVDHYRAVMPYADRLPDHQRAELLEGYSHNSFLVGFADEALTARLSALEVWESIGQARKVGDNLSWLSGLHWWWGRREDGQAAAARAITVLESTGSGRELAMAYSNQAAWQLLDDKLAAAMELSSRAIAVAQQAGDQQTVASALICVGSARMQGGDEAGRANLEQAIEVAVSEGLPERAAWALINLAWYALGFRDYQRARQDLERGLKFTLDRGLAGHVQFLMGMRAWWRLDQGDWPGAEADAREVLGQPEQPGLSVMPALVALGRLQARRGDVDAADTLQEATRRAFVTSTSHRIAPVAAACAEHAWLCGEPGRAATEATRGFGFALRAHHPWFAGELAWWLQRAGGRPDIPEWIAEPYRLLLSGDWQGAAHIWQRLGCPYNHAEALACADKEDALLRALETFDRLGAVAAAQQLRRRLRNHGSVRVPRGPRPVTAGNAAHLTARQVEVLALLATGLSNTEIAKQLSLSVRTVDHNVAAVLAKLSVHSRHQAVEAARRLGMIPAQDRQPNDQR
jgi:DNA-binding CsgD family transcriptional regulator/tetratricopeptide (TPR) repeat protein